TISTTGTGAGEGPWLTTTTEWFVEAPRWWDAGPDTCTPRLACTSTEIAALSLSLPATGSAVWEVAAAVRVTVVAAVAGVAAVGPAQPAIWDAAGPAAAHAAVVWPAARLAGSQFHPAGAVNERPGSSASTARPTPGNWAASGPA